LHSWHQGIFDEVFSSDLAVSYPLRTCRKYQRGHDCAHTDLGRDLSGLSDINADVTLFIQQQLAASSTHAGFLGATPTFGPSPSFLQLIYGSAEYGTPGWGGTPANQPKLILQTSFTSVPEPSTFATCCLLGLAAFAHRRLKG
jgi:hypothetical protein